MKLKEFREYLNRLVANNPEYDNLDCVYSTDDEGNSFHQIHYHPTVGNFTPEGYKGDFESISPEEKGIKKPNAICIN